MRWVCMGHSVWIALMHSTMISVHMSFGINGPQRTEAKQKNHFSSACICVVTKKSEREDPMTYLRGRASLASYWRISWPPALIFISMSMYLDRVSSHDIWLKCVWDRIKEARMKESGSQGGSSLNLRPWPYHDGIIQSPTQRGSSTYCVLSYAHSTSIGTMPWITPSFWNPFRAAL